MTPHHYSDWDLDEQLILSARHEEIDGIADSGYLHLLRCTSCAAKYDDMQESLSLYREGYFIATETLASRQKISTDELVRRPTTKKAFEFDAKILLPQAWGWALAMILMLAIMIPAFILQQRAARKAQIAKDNLLLQQIDEEISESVPNPLQSLSGLVMTGENSGR